jgi:hypothetical protein
LKIPITKRAGRMAQSEGLEFKPQYCKKKKKKKRKEKMLYTITQGIHASKLACKRYLKEFYTQKRKIIQ